MTLSNSQQKNVEIIPAGLDGGHIIRAVLIILIYRIETLYILSLSRRPVNYFMVYLVLDVVWM